MRQRLGLLAGIGLAIFGTLGIAAAGILWTFQSPALGLGATITSLVLLAISLVLLRPLPILQADVEGGSTASLAPLRAPSISLQRPQASLIGISFAVLGTLGLAISGILWNFQGIAFGLTGTITSIASLLFAAPFLWPMRTRRVIAEPIVTAPVTAPEIIETPAVTTTAEAIALELAEIQNNAPAVKLVTFAPEHLLPGRTLPRPSRRPGASIRRSYSAMVEELFRS